MELRVLGPIEATNGSGSVDLGPRMQRALLGILVMDAGTVVSSDRLIDCLWGERPPPTAAKALQVYVSNLRRALEPGRPPGTPSEVLVTQAPGYVLRVGDEAIDASRFEAVTARGEEALRSGQMAEAYEGLSSALGLWRGTAYEDLAFESFLQAEIARLHDLRATAAEARLEALLGMGRLTDAVVDAERMVFAEPLRERRWALLALALYRAGRQAEALRSLDRARRSLAEELGLDPSPELRRLEQDILVQSPALDLDRPDRVPGGAGRRVPLLVAMQAYPPTLRSVAAGGAVLPASATPHGFGLIDMARLVVPFTMRRYDSRWMPDTPFQLLYVEAVDVRPVGTGLLASGTNSFAVTRGTYLYAPMFIANDEPRVLGEFPSDADAGPRYLFGPKDFGARDFEIMVDGVPTPIGPDYVVGPFQRPDHWSRVVMIGAFLEPLDVGMHTVRIRGGCFGSGVPDVFGASFLCEDFTYTVEVLARGHATA